MSTTALPTVPVLWELDLHVQLMQTEARCCPSDPPHQQRAQLGDPGHGGTTRTSRSHSHRRAPVPLHNFPLKEVGGRINCEIYQRTLFHPRTAYQCDVWIASRPAVAGDVLAVISSNQPSIVMASIHSPDPDLLPPKLTSPTTAAHRQPRVAQSPIAHLRSHTDARLCIALERLRFVTVDLLLSLLGQMLLFS